MCVNWTGLDFVPTIATGRWIARSTVFVQRVLMDVVRGFRIWNELLSITLRFCCSCHFFLLLFGPSRVKCWWSAELWVLCDRLSGVVRVECLG